MKIKRIILEPDPRLRAPNVDVTEPWEEIRPYVKLMFKAMYRTGNGVGLAAPQVGWHVRLFVMNPVRFKYSLNFDQKQEHVFWNPSVALLGDPVPMREGCLSLPGVFGDVPRHPRVHLVAMSPQGPVEQDFEGFAAQIIQHEVDHLAGRLCYERLVKKKEASA